MHGIGIIGAGSIAHVHMRAAAELESTRLVAAADTDPERLAEACAAHGCQGFDDYRNLLACGEVDIVIVCTPHGLHCEPTVAALEAGKDVLVEKPMAVSVEQCDAMIAASQRAGKQLSVGHMHHFNPANMAVGKLLEERALGDLVCLCDEGYRPFVPQRQAWYLDKATHGGLWYQNGVHLIDRSCWWTGSRVAMAMLQYENGVYSTLIHVWWKNGGGRFSTEFVCTEGMIRLANGLESGNDDLFVGRDETGNWEKVEVAGTHDATTRQLEEFVASVDAGTEPPVTGEYGRHVVEVMAACMESSRSGREVVLPAQSSGIS